MTDDRPKARGWSITALVYGTKRELVDLRITRTVYERHAKATSRLRMVRKLEEPATLSMEAWETLSDLLRAAGATVEERLRTRDDLDPPEADV